MSLPDIEVYLVKTDDDVAQFLAWLHETLNRGEAIAIDTETAGLDWWTYAFTRLVQFGTRDEGYAIPVEWWGQVIRHAMELVSKAGVPVIMHNAPHDMHALDVCGYPLPSWANVHDTAILHRLHRSDLSAALKSKHTSELLDDDRLVNAGRDALNKRAKELGFRGEDDKWRFIPVDDPMYWAYGVMDTVLTRRVYDAHEETIALFGEAYDRERQYQAIMFRAEKRGLLINEKYTMDLRVEMTEKIDKLLFFLQSNGLDNPNSNNQIIALLEEDFGFVPWEFTETGEPSVNKDVLKVLAEAGGLQASVIEAIIDYKRLTKWRSTYIDRFLYARDHHNRMHPSIKTMEARTGRSSITNPPFQTLPKSDPVIRNCVKAARGERIVSIDYSNQEPRILAHFGRSEALMDFILRGEGSVHDWVAAHMFGPDYTPFERKKAKQIGLGRSYGAGARKTAQAVGAPEEEIAPLLPPYDELMGLAALNAGIAEAASGRMPTPYVVTSGGRRVYADPDKIYTLTNYLMQGSGADVLKEAVIRLDDADLADYILVPVHDELVFSFPKDEAVGMAELAGEIMHDDSFAVPLPVGISEPATTWGAVVDD